jgi:Sap, sulfolipid-1-addressing protein
VLHVAIQLLIYALLAGLSPVAFAATIAVIPAGRLKVLGFGTGFVVAQLMTCALFVIIGVAATTRKRHPDLHASLEIALALALTWLVIHVRGRAPAATESSSPRTQAMVERLGRLRFLTTLLAGLLLGIGGPKRLVLTALAAATIATSGIHYWGEAALVVLYVLLATVLVWAPPVVLFVLLGERSVEFMKRAQEEVAKRQPKVTIAALLVLAALLVIDAVGTLLL